MWEWGVTGSVLDFPAPAAPSTPRICGNTACQGSPAPTTQAQLLQGLLQHKFRCVQVILYLRFSHICQSSSEVALRKQSSSTAEKLHIDRAVVSPECSSCATSPQRGAKATPSHHSGPDRKAQFYNLLFSLGKVLRGLKSQKPLQWPHAVVFSENGFSHAETELLFQPFRK